MTIIKYENLTQDDKDFILNQEATDHGNALCLLHLNEGKFVDVPEWGLLYYNGLFWEQEFAKKHLYDATVNMMILRGMAALEVQNTNIQKCTSTNQGKVNSCISAFTQLLEIAKPTDFFNHQRHLLNVQNGVLNLKTGELLHHNPDYGFTWVCPINYNPNASTAKWETFLGQTIQHYNEVKDYIKMAVGYTLTGETKEEKLFYLFGPTRSGKSTFLDVISCLLGDDIAKGTSFTTFTKSRNGTDQGFDLAPLHAARFISATEGESQVKMNEAMVKSITGNDRLSAAFKGKDYFTFKPSWKIWLASNYKPSGSVTDSAFWYRLNLINFPNSFAGSENKNLKDELCSKESLEGVLKWAVEGSKLWYGNGQGLVTPEVFVKALNDARQELDLVQQWIDGACELNPTAYMTVKDINDHFENWCIDNGIDGWQKNTVTKVLREKGFKEAGKRIEQVGLNGEKPKAKYTKVIYGLELNTSEVTPWE